MSPVELDTAPRRARAAVSFPAPEAATQIVAAGVPGMSEKKDPAMLTPLQAGPQIRPGTQQRPDLGIVLAHQIAHPAIAVPIRPELEMSLDFGCYKPRR